MRGSWKCPAGVLHPVTSLTERSRHRSEAGVLVYLKCDHGYTVVGLTPWGEISARFAPRDGFEERRPAA